MCRTFSHAHKQSNGSNDDWHMSLQPTTRWEAETSKGDYLKFREIYLNSFDA